MKTNILCRSLLILLVCIVGFSVNTHRAEAGTELDPFISNDLHLTKDGSPYIVSGDTGLHVDSGNTLTIDPGVTLLLSSGWLYIEQANLVIGNASSSEKVVLDKKPGASNWSGIYLNISKAVINSLEIKNANAPIYSWYGDLSLKNSSIDGTQQGLMSTSIYAMEGNLNIASTTLSNFQNKAIYANSTKGTISKSIISENGTGIFYDGEASVNFSGTENNFDGNDINIYNANNATTLDFRGNDWGTGGAPEQGSVFGKVLTGYEEALPCCSSVVFIPGLMATRLHLDDNQLWEPNRNADVEKLYLDENGQSINQSIQVGEIIDTTNVLGSIGSTRIYKSFIEDMDSLVEKGVITSWEALPYDWRLGIDSSSIDPLISEIEKVASTSITKKVNIVAHSHGGLVAKYIIDYLKINGREELIDNLIMVATPQLGTPNAVGALLHGDGQELGLGFVLNKKNARKWGENMMSAYNLLPSIEYLEKVNSPLVYFDGSLDSINTWRSTYGDLVDSYEEFESFITGGEGRSKPVFEDVGSPNTINYPLFSESQNTHQILDYMTFNSPLKVYNIAGWGKMTPIAIKYFSTPHCGIGNLFCITGKELGLDHSTVKTFDGDGTVVSPSSTFGENTENYYLNLQELNTNMSKNFGHSTILEVPSLLDLMNNIIVGSSTDNISYITQEQPNVVPFKNIEIGMHSPADIHIYDLKGNHTGLVKNQANSDLVIFEENVPNSSYEEWGEGKYITVQNSSDIKIKINGTDLGTFTLDIKDPDTNQLLVGFADIPVTELTKAEIALSSNVASTTLLLDYNGDNKIDFVIKPSSDLEPILYLNILKQTIISFNLKEKVEKKLLDKIDKVIKVLNKDKDKKALSKLKKLSINITNKNWKAKKMTEVQKNEIISIIDEIISSI